jgi:hypothetical protein
LAFSEHFLDENHLHNLDEADVLDAVIGRRIHISKRFKRNGKTRRLILAKTDDEYITIVCEESADFWWVLSAYPSDSSDRKRAREQGVGEEQ